MTGTDTMALWLGAAFYGAVGGAAFVRPRTLLASFGIRAEGIDAANEIRAVYGGFPLALAGMLAWATQGGPLADGVVVAVAISGLGMAGGRIVSAMIDRSLGRAPALFLGLEVIVSVVLLTAI